jgi:hypothetical protein
MRIETFSNLAKTEFEVNWIVEGLMSSGQWTYFVGPPGSGKSMLTIQLCDALQEGKPFLGMQTFQHNCLYIQADAGISEWKEQIKNLAIDSVAWTMHDIEENFVDDRARVEYLHNLVWGTYAVDTKPGSLSQVIKHIPYTFVVFDCLNKITGHDLNTKGAMSHVLSQLDYITSKVTCSKCGKECKAKDTKCSECEQLLDARTKIIDRIHYLLIHHPTAGKTRGVDAGSGYKGFAGVCGNMLTLANEILVLEKCKIAKKKEIKLQRGMKGEWSIQSSVMNSEEEKALAALLGIE